MQAPPTTSQNTVSRNSPSFYFPEKVAAVFYRQHTTEHSLFPAIELYLEKCKQSFDHRPEWAVAIFSPHSWNLQKKKSPKQPLIILFVQHIRNAICTPYNLHTEPEKTAFILTHATKTPQSSYKFNNLARRGLQAKITYLHLKVYRQRTEGGAFHGFFTLLKFH